jgi:hypothetical protein
MKVELGNVVKYHDDSGNTFTGTVIEIHPDKSRVLFARFDSFHAHGWFSMDNVFFKVMDKCTEHDWGVAHDRIETHTFGTECFYHIECKICAARYIGSKSYPMVGRST